MKKLDIAGIGLLSACLLGSALFAMAQQDDKRTNGLKRDNQAKPQKVEQARLASPAGKALVPEHALVRTADQMQRHNDMEQQRGSNFDRNHKTWEQRGGYGGARVPDDRLKKSFGKSHTFRMADMPFRGNGGLLRFQYDGYWMTMMEPFPEYWGSNWDLEDELYVDFDGTGYYLYNARFADRPGVAIIVSN